MTATSGHRCRHTPRSDLNGETTVSGFGFWFHQPDPQPTIRRIGWRGWALPTGEREEPFIPTRGPVRVCFTRADYDREYEMTDESLSRRAPAPKASTIGLILDRPGCGEKKKLIRSLCAVLVPARQPTIDKSTFIEQEYIMTYKNGIDQIYIPPAAALVPLREELLDKWPQLHRRAQKAETIILERRLKYDPEERQWYTESDREGGTTYPQIAQKCPNCPDYVSNFSPMAAGERWCKHKIAYRLYREYLERQINERLMSLSESMEVTAGTLRTDGLSLYDAHQPRLICRIRRDREQFVRLFDSAAVYEFSLWMLGQVTLCPPIGKAQTPELAIA